MYVPQLLFIHSSVDGHLHCFPVIAIVNSAAVNNGIHVSLSTLVSSGYMCRSGISGSYGGFIPSFLRNLHTVFHSGFPPTVWEFSLFSTPFPAFIVCRLFDEGHSDQCEVKPHVVFICISLIMSDIEHFLMSFLVSCMSSLEKCLFRSFSPFFIGLFFWYWVLWAACIFWKLMLCQLFHLLLFSPILRVVFSPCL